MSNNNVRICSIDAKDLYIADHLKIHDPNGYSVLRQDGTVNIKKFVNSLDFSLDLLRIREVYSRIYRNNYFSFWNHGHEFTTRCINVTFKYSNKEYNKFGENIYIKFGYRIQDIKLKNHVYIKHGELIAIETNKEIPKGKEINPQKYGDNFVYRDGKYHVKSNKTLNTVADLRENLYENGFTCDGIHYVRFKRSSGSSRVGKCLFIDEKLYPAMHKYELLGLNLRKDQGIDLAAWEAYIALTLSSIIDTIQIDPNSILVIDDYESVFKDKVMATRIVDSSLSTQSEEVEINNSIWDGQSLIDKSIMGEYSQYGMILLRNDFFKTCAFNTNIQEFFADHGITEISQLNGYTLATEVSQIKLITTPSSIKFLKFGKLEEWLTRISSTFGVVKHEKKTHFFEGGMVQTHYQLLNTLQMSREEMREFLQPTFHYMSQLKTNPPVMRYHIHYPREQIKLTKKPMKTKNDIVFTLMGLNEKFCRTQWYADFRMRNILAYRENLRYGHVLINGNYSTLLGNPLEMLYQSIGLFKGESLLGVDNVHSTRFEYGKRILGSRSPHVCVGNILLVNNVSSPETDKYFNLTEEIVCINAINQNIQQRLNGADYDSDTMLLTDNELLIKAAEKNYEKFLVPTNFVESTKKKRYYNNSQKADLDIKTSVNKIGDIINKSQELQSYMWHQLNNGGEYTDIDDLYRDICQLSVMSNIEIDLSSLRVQ